MDPAALADQLSKIWLGEIALSFFDCLFFLAMGIAAAWSVALVNKTQEDRAKLQDEQRSRDRAEFVLLIQMVKRIVERLDNES